MNSISLDDEVLLALHEFARSRSSFPMVAVLTHDLYGDCKFTSQQVTAIAVEMNHILELVPEGEVKFWISVVASACQSANGLGLAMFCYAD
jgi:hypothetical protein